MISGDPAVRRELEKFELMQIWISDGKEPEAADARRDRMAEQFGTFAIPLHVVLAPDGAELVRYVYDPTDGPADYLAFLREGLDAFEKR